MTENASSTPSLAWSDFAVMGLYFALVVGLGLLFYNKFLAVCFDQEFARLRGVSVEFYFILLLCLTALTVVMLVTVVGLVMVIALLTIPVAIAGHFAARLWHIMVLATLISIGLTSTGLAVSFEPNLPAGAMTISLAGALYVLVMAGSHLHKRIRSGQPQTSNVKS